MAILTTEEIIARFNLQVDDASELSSDEELALAQEVYEDICDDRPWEWLKKTATATTSTSVPYITLPTDFKLIAPNSYNRSVVFVGADYQEYVLVPFEQRRNYRDQDGFCYLDMVNKRLYFTKQPISAESVEYDYIMVPPVLTTGTSPLIPNKHEVISYGMAAKFNPIELTDKTASYRNENIIEYRKMLSDLATNDALLKLNIS